MKVGKKDLEDYLQDIANKSHNPISVEELRNIHFQKIYANDDMLHLMKELKNKGYELFILSNESREGLIQKTDKFHLHEIFEKIYCSAELGMAKPDKRIFEYVMRDAQIIPETTLFIDDLDRNINIAKELEFQTILFKNIEQIKDLQLL
jgi:putative hydrolase of the HAD superfamily